MDKHKLLKDVFGHSEFRPGQEESIDCLLSGRDLLSVMPTGAGKSICYQLPALMVSGITVVVSPLISLMKDQSMSLTQNGVDAAFLNSTLSTEEYIGTLKLAEIGALKILFVAPERLETEYFQRFAEKKEISMVIIDEAHCVSQWGQDFRPSYLHIAQFIAGLPKRPVVGAFTATATDRVKADIKKQLGLISPYEITTGFDRPNLYFQVIHAETKNKPRILTELLNKFGDRNGIVYCSTRRQTEEVTAICRAAGVETVMYHAGMNDADRLQSQEDFIYDRARVMAATNAFGMGIDKSNVGFVIHYSMPKSPEAYYQEAGRAGRDGTAADCVLMYSPADVNTAEYFIKNMVGEGLTPAELAEAKRQDRRRLGAMIEYCTTTDCLRTYLLKYFGEECKSCSGCSNCGAEFRDEDITDAAQRIISCVFRLSQRGLRFAAGTICSVLRGVSTKKMSVFKLENLSTYGIMAGYNRRRLTEIIDYLVRTGYLYRNEEEYRCIYITEKGHRAVKEREKITMKVAVKAAAAELQQGIAPKKEDKKGLAPAQGADNELFLRLKGVRSSIAAKERVPVYIVFSNAALEEMAAKMPVSKAEFLQINGVGEAKLARYGALFIDEIKAFMEEKGL